LIVIQKESSDGKQREDYFYLIGTQSRGKPANFTLWRNQFDVVNQIHTTQLSRFS